MSNEIVIMQSDKAIYKGIFSFSPNLNFFHHDKCITKPLYSYYNKEEL